MLMKWVLRLGFGLLVALITYKAYKTITSKNIAAEIRSAIRSSKDKMVRKMVGRALAAVVTSKEVNRVKLSVFEKDIGEAQIEIQCNAVDDTIWEGMAMTMVA